MNVKPDSKSTPSPAVKRVTSWILLLIPPVIFYRLLAKSIDGLPIGDDYGAILRFLLRFQSHAGLLRLHEVITYQNNEYRLMFEDAIAAVQLSIFGHVNLLILKIVGDLIVIPILGALWLIWKSCGGPPDYQLIAFVPVSWILFQLQFEGALNYTMAGLEIIPVTLFALLTCYLLSRDGRVEFSLSLLTLALCVGSNGNGLFMIPVGLLMLIQQKRTRRIVGWTLASLVMAAIYFLGYNFAANSSHSHSNNDILGILLHFSPLFALAFIGNIAAILNPVPAILFGMGLIFVFATAIYCRLYSKSPALFYSMLFFFVTALAVSGLRSTYGLEMALNSTYRINSTVFVCLTYLYLAGYAKRLRLSARSMGVGVVLFSVLLIAFNLESDRGGYRVLMLKKSRAEISMMRWVQAAPRPTMNELSPDELTVGRESSDAFWPESYGTTLPDCIREGIYELPEPFARWYRQTVH